MFAICLTFLCWSLPSDLDQSILSPQPHNSPTTSSEYQHPLTPALSSKYQQLVEQATNSSTFETVSSNLSCFVLILIMSTPSDRGRVRRNAIRNTWAMDASQLETPVIVKFVIGINETGREFNGMDAERGDPIRTDEAGSDQPSEMKDSIAATDETGDELKLSIADEDSRFHDMLLLPEVFDIYTNLAYKVLRSFVWSVQNVDYRYLLKTDDDSYVVIKRLVDELVTRKSHKPLYWGRIYQNASVVQLQGKNAEKNWFLCDHYIPFAVGAGYVLSYEIIQAIAVNADKLTLYNNEDTSVGTWVAGFNMERKDDARFNVAKEKCQDQQLLAHYVNPSRMYIYHKRLKLKGSLCYSVANLK